MEHFFLNTPLELAFLYLCSVLPSVHFHRHPAQVHLHDRRHWENFSENHAGLQTPKSETITHWSTQYFGNGWPGLNGRGKLFQFLCVNILNWKVKIYECWYIAITLLFCKIIVFTGGCVARGRGLWIYKFVQWLLQAVNVCLWPDIDKWLQHWAVCRCVDKERKKHCMK